MMHDQDHHFEPPKMEAFLNDRLSQNEQHLFVAHLDRCETCRLSLETAAGTSRWWDEAKTCLTEQQPTSGSTSGISSQDGPVLDDRLRRQLGQILAPSDDPRMLGRIGTFEIVGIIGRGGTGIVLKAFDPSLDRFVAIKILAPELAITGAARERFAREARAAAAVTHENVIPIHAVSEFMGHGYIVMQYVPGHSLEYRIRVEGPLQIDVILRIGMHVARALAAARQQGLVHRDIKPANILLEEGIDRPVVTDFGLARVANDASLTNSGVVSGTPNYMSPEQASGENVDAKSDLFSLGSVMYAMCVGHPPFRSDTVLGVLRRVSDDDQSSIRAQNAAVPSWLEDFVFRLLEKRPQDRFDSAEEVAQLLSKELAYQQNPTGLAEPERSWARGPHGSKRDRLTLSVTLLLIGAASFVLALWPRTPESDAKKSPTPSRTHYEQQMPSMSTAQWDTEWSLAIREAEQLERSPATDETRVFVDAWMEEAVGVQRIIEELEADPE